MKNQKNRSMKVYSQNGRNYKATPTIILKGQWLEELEHYIQSKDGVDFIPSSIYLSAVEAKLRTEMGAERMLAEVLAPIRDRYDYVLVDTAPSFGMLAWYFFTEDFASWSLSLSALLISPSVALIRLATSFLPRDSVSTPLSESHCFI